MVPAHNIVNHLFEDFKLRQILTKFAENTENANDDMTSHSS